MAKTIRRLPITKGPTGNKDFAKRLATACENHPLAPPFHGRQVWLARRLEEQYAIKVSRESVRKWFAGESVPRRGVLSAIANALDVDEVWLSLGVVPDLTPTEKRKHDATVNGGINLVAGFMQLSGSQISFPESDNDTFDIFSIVKGKRRTFVVRLIKKENITSEIVIPFSDKNELIVIKPTDNPLLYSFYIIDPETIKTHGDVKGTVIELGVRSQNDKVYLNRTEAKVIDSFANLSKIN